MIFAAGLGTRLKPFTDNHPKALAVVSGKTLLEHNISFLRRYGITDVVVNVHHFPDQIEQLLSDNSGFGSNVTISDERNEVLETGGGLLKALPYFKDEEHIVVMNVDILTSLDLGKMIEAHTAKHAVATLAVMDRPSSRNFLFDETMRLCGWQNNATGQQRMVRDCPSPRPFAFSGIQVLSSALLHNIRQTGKFSIVETYLDLAPSFLIRGYDHTGDNLIDVGKPESIEKASAMFR